MMVFLNLKVNVGLISYARQLTLLILIRLFLKGYWILRFSMLFLWDCSVCFSHSFGRFLDSDMYNFSEKTLHLIVDVFIP